MWKRTQGPSLTVRFVSDHMSTRRKAVNENDGNGRTLQKIPLLSRVFKKRDMSQVCLGAAQHFCCVRTEKRHSTPISKPHPNCGVWLSRSQEALQLFERNFKFYGRISAKQYMNSSLRNIGWCNKNIDPQDTSLSINNTEQWLKKSPDNNSTGMLWYEMWHWRRLFNQNISEILMSWQNLFFNFSSWLCKSNNRL